MGTVLAWQDLDAWREQQEAALSYIKGDRPRVGLPKTKHPLIPGCSAYHPAGVAKVCNLDLDLVCILGLQRVHQEIGSTKWC